METKQKYRHELKYEITYGQFLLLQPKLEAIMQKDVHAKGNGIYKITSLYFDNYQDKALREKIDGVSVRDKYRIRYYNDNEVYIVLEKKSKNKSLCAKKSAVITKEECEQILSGDVDWMLGTKNVQSTEMKDAIENEDMQPAVLKDFYFAYKNQLLRPKTIVVYDRIPYVYGPGNVRVTFDMNIRTGMYHKELFDENHPMVNVSFSKKMIMEVKFDEYLPEIIQMVLQSGNLRVGAFSKYAACRGYE